MPKSFWIVDYYGGRVGLVGLVDYYRGGGFGGDCRLLWRRWVWFGGDLVDHLLWREFSSFL